MKSTRITRTIARVPLKLLENTSTQRMSWQNCFAKPEFHFPRRGPHQHSMHESSEARHIIVNADDFGLTDGINRGIIDAHTNGIVTSASLMVRSPAAKRAVDLASAHPKLSVGLHFDIAEWRYQKGEWEAAYQVVDSHDAAAIEAELRRQLATFQRLMGRAPSHLDSHQHFHKSEPAREILLRASNELRVPLRGCDPSISHCGDF